MKRESVAVMEMLSFISVPVQGLSNVVISSCLVIVIVTCITFCWRYWKLVRAYRGFPAVRVDLEYILKILTGRYPLDIKEGVPLTSVIFQDMVRRCKRFEKEGLCLMWFFRPYLMVYNEEFCKRLFNEPAIADKIFLYSLIEDLIGRGLITSKAEIWKSHRKLLNPVFYPGVLKGKMHIFNKNAVDFVQKLEAIAGKPTTDSLDLIKYSSFNILAESILGVELGNEKYGSEISRYLENIEQLTEVFVQRISLPWLYWKVTMPFFSAGRKYLKLIDELRGFTQKVLLEMKSCVVETSVPNENLGSDVESQKTLARILLEQHLNDPASFTMKDVQDHVTTIMAAGHDTTSYCMLWCLHMLGLHPEVQDKVFKEIEEIKGTNITYEDLSELKYLECVIKETLRLYAIVPMYGRKLDKEIQCGKYTLPKGAEIGFFLYMLHRNPNIYPDPDRFDPDRFAETADIRPWMHMPFAEGYRSCIGKKFAMMEQKVLLAHVLRRFEVRTLDGIEDTDLDWRGVITTIKPIRMLFTPRQSQFTET